MRRAVAALAPLCAALAMPTAARPALADCPVATTPLVLTPPVSVADAYAGGVFDIDGDTLVVGAPLYDAPPSGPSESGAAHVFRRSGTGWTHEATLLPPTPTRTGVFGWAVGVSGDDVAVCQQTGVGPTQSGVVYVFRRTTDGEGRPSWSSGVPLPDAPQRQRALFGRHLAVRGDRMLIGCIGPVSVTDPGGSAGEAHVYERSPSEPSGWAHTATLRAADGTPASAFGYGVALADGVAVVSAIGDDAAGANAGAVYVFEKAATGWVQAAKFAGPLGSASPHFGKAVAADGTTVVAGADFDAAISGDSGPMHRGAGVVRVFSRSAPLGEPGSWSVETTIPNPAGASASATGYGTAVDVVGDRLAVGARLEDTSGLDSGVVYIFRRSSGGGVAWNLERGFGVNAPGATAAWLGTRVALDTAGPGDADDRLMAGAPGFGGAGAVLVFDACAEPAAPGQGPRCLPTVPFLFSWVGAWFQSGPAADYDANGAVEIADLFAFLRDWMSGC